MDYLEKIHDVIEEYSTADVVVAGASYSGLSIAHELAKNGLRVLIVEHNPGITPLAYYSGLWNYVVVRDDVKNYLEKEINLHGFYEVDNGYIVNSIELYTKYINRLIDEGVKIIVGHKVVPYFKIDEESGELVLLGAFLRTSDEEIVEEQLIVKTKYLVDSSGLDAYVSMDIVERLKPPIIPQGYGPILPSSREIIEKTNWVLEDMVLATGLAAATIFGASLPYPDISPIIESGLSGAKLLINSRKKSFRPNHSIDIQYL